MLHTNKAIIVEGKYDKIHLRSVTDAIIITTEGFNLFNNAEKRTFIKKLAHEKGIIVITDSDAAGFKIRNLIKNLVPENTVSHIYIPDVFGKEKRKDTASKEGKLGVEGINTGVLKQALINSGEFGETALAKNTREITNADLYELGFMGQENSAEKRRALLNSLNLPARLRGGAMLSVLNAFISYEDFVEKANAVNIKSDT